MPFHTFQVCIQPQILLTPVSCSAYDLEIFSTYFSLHFLEANQKRELEIICGDRSKIHETEIQIVGFFIL